MTRRGAGISAGIMLFIASAAFDVLHAQQAPMAGSGATAAASTERRNWYNDPFFALSHAIADCPVPLGPMMTRAQMEDDAHYRVERGTTCWLAHKCTKPNSYMYDPEIAGAIHARFTNPHAFDGTSLWITVQRRFVYAEGCAPASFDRHALQQQLEAIPDVEQVFVRIATGTHGAMPYKTLAQPDMKPDAQPDAQPQ
ncbi:BON domain-containing protein [Paraburkholderia phymatum]|uniref:BON domain-containing protein n=1 Tax=Paraburkholderia phymatum TaxID=148447 RepID=UPI003174AA75